MTNLAFPANIVDTIEARILASSIPGVENVQQNELMPADPNGTVALQASDWTPMDWEIGSPEPFGRYSIFLTTLVKHSSRDEGRVASSILAKNLRVMLYRDQTLNVQLAQLSETVLGHTEKVLRGRVKTQRFLDGELKGVFTFVTLTQYDVDTEIS